MACVLLSLVYQLAAAHSPGQMEAELRETERYAQFVDQAAPKFELQDTESRLVKLTGLRGKVVVLNFVYARCREQCPLHSAIIATIQSQVAEAGLTEQVLFVTVATDSEDPISTAAVMREHGSRYGLEPENWVFIFGGLGRERAGIDLAKAYGLEFVPTATGEQLHGVVTQIIDSQGRLRARFHGLNFNPASLTTYAAALVHGEHQSRGSAVDAALSSREDKRSLQLIIGTIFAVGAVLAFGAWTHFRRPR